MKKLIKLFEKLNENEIIKIIEKNENKIVIIDKLNTKLTYINESEFIKIYFENNNKYDKYEINDLIEIEKLIYENEIYDLKIIL